MEAKPLCLRTVFSMAAAGQPGMSSIRRQLVQIAWWCSASEAISYQVELVSNITFLTKPAAVNDSRMRYIVA